MKISYIIFAKTIRLFSYLGHKSGCGNTEVTCGQLVRVILREETELLE